MIMVMTMATTGCSFAVTRGPSPGRSSCSRSYAAPVVDTIIGAGLLGLGVVGAATAKHSNNATVPEEAIYVPLIVIGLVEVVSAAYGHGAVRRCRASTS